MKLSPHWRVSQITVTLQPNSAYAGTSLTTWKIRHWSHWHRPLPAHSFPHLLFMPSPPLKASVFCPQSEVVPLSEGVCTSSPKLSYRIKSLLIPELTLVIWTLQVVSDWTGDFVIGLYEFLKMMVKQLYLLINKQSGSNVTGVMFLAVMTDTTLSIIYRGFSCCFSLLSPFPAGVVEMLGTRLRVEQDTASC